MKRLFSILLVIAPFTATWADAERDQMMLEAKRNFGRVLQDPLGNFRGIISENAMYGGFDETNGTAGLVNIQGLYAIPMPEKGINFIPRLIVPIVGLPPETSLPIWAQSPNPSKEDEWGMSDVILQTFVGPSDSGKVK